MREMNDRSWVDDAIILRAEVGSGVHGLAIAGSDDHDEMGICIEPFELAWSTRGAFEQHIFRTAHERTGKNDAPSQHGDTDLCVYSLAKWTRLALNGNPTVLSILFAPAESTFKMDARGGQLRDMASCFASRRAGHRFLGYMNAQKQRLLGERGQKNVKRQELVNKYVFDVKYSSHLLRLGYQGIEFMQTGRLTLPMDEPVRSTLRGVKTGSMDLNGVLTLAGELESELSDLLTTSPLPEQPDTDRVNAWMLDTYLNAWSAGWGHDRHMEIVKAVR